MRRFLPVDSRFEGLTNRSPLLAQILSQMDRTSVYQPQSYGALAAGLGATYFQKKGLDAALASQAQQQQAQQKALAQALMQAQGGNSPLPGTGVMLGDVNHPYGGSGPNPMGAMATLAGAGYSPEQLGEFAKLMPEPPKSEYLNAGNQFIQTQNGSPTGRTIPIGISPNEKYGQEQAGLRNTADINARAREGALDRGAAAARQAREIAANKELASIKAQQDALKPSEKDKNIGMLFGSMRDAEKNISQLKGDDTSSSLNAALGAFPATKVFQGENFRKYESNALRWAANLIYIKSGATAPPEEVRSTYMQYFPQPGDGPENIAQKNIARQQELANISAMYPNVTAGYQPSGPKSGATQRGGWSIEPAN